MKRSLFVTIMAVLVSVAGHTQELYVFSEPASNMPAKSISAKWSTKWLRSLHSDRVEQRHTPEVMLGLNKQWMVHVAGTFSDMYSTNVRWESVRLYTKYRFLSIDDVHQHFRMAAFAEATHSVNPAVYEEVSLDGDQSGVMGGIIVTQLWDKLAISGTGSFAQVTTKKPKYIGEAYPWQALNYSLSAGYLVLPREYTSYKQVNLNVYVELLGQQTLDRKQHYLDLAPAVQLIFNSNAKLNVGHRFQLNGDMHRMAEKSWLVAFEYVFLNALQKKRS
ncbi:hypothetical protein [Paraflavitalea sp. CAU 1676]|uniref:hypothetical protein n=1 Tax=Paraflavitalea sp. CAU 1676 TaxID=3032598 RepID=UPI0023DA5ED7|nr:hypothetical protein [Paraflavitalea sp. CAU 1676]MDF2190273.1 hypothetical protein [Paraflavitalea sp. CAU 1676]